MSRTGSIGASLFLFACLVVLCAAVPGAARAHPSSPAGALYTENPNCRDGEFNKASQAGENCGGTLTGPGTIYLHPCGQSLCSSKFTLSLILKGASFCSNGSYHSKGHLCVNGMNMLPFTLPKASFGKKGSARWGPKGGLIIANASLVPRSWGPNTPPYGLVTNSTSLPQTFSITKDPRNPKEFTLEILIQGSVAQSYWGSANGHWVGDARIHVVVGKQVKSTLKGKITALSGCDTGTCKQEPLRGVKVAATGAGEGSATSRKDGTYSMRVPVGSYTVKPSLAGHDFDPVSRKVTVGKAGVKGVDFRTCATETSPAPRRLASRAAATADVCAGPDAIDWKMTPRTTVETVESFGEGDGLPPANWVNPNKFTATLFTRKDRVKFDCGSDTRFIWTVTPVKKLFGGKQPRVDCESAVTVTEQGTYTVSAQMQKRIRGAWRDVRKPIPGTIKVKDWLIVGMGDSNGSGEGNPPFYYLRCNRSEKSYQVQTALTVEKNDPHSSVTFLHASCSGARVEHLMDRTYAGTRPAQPAFPPQIKQVQILLDHYASGGSRRKVDVALISAGVNDLAFGPVLAYCIQHVGLGDPTLFSPSTWIPPSQASLTANPCQNRLVVPLPEPGGDRIGSFVDDAHPDSLSNTLAVYVAREQGRLAHERFEGLSAALSTIGVRSDHVFMAQYPDFSHDEKGKTCSFSGAARMPPSTWAWLGQQSTLLNAAVKTGSAPYGWNIATWKASAFLDHGYCSQTSYIRAIINASLAPFLKTNKLGGYPVLVQPYADAAGPFHPTAKGHEIEAGGTFPAVCRKLFSGDATCNAPKK